MKLTIRVKLIQDGQQWVNLRDARPFFLQLWSLQVLENVNIWLKAFKAASDESSVCEVYFTELTLLQRKMNEIVIIELYFFHFNNFCLTLKDGTAYRKTQPALKKTSY